MKTFIQSLGLLAFAALISSGCSKTESGPAQPTAVAKLSGQEYAVLSGDIKSSEDKAEGTGSLVFRLPLPDEDNNYDLTFDLQEGGSITLVTQADAKLTTGVEFTLYRKNGNVGAKIKDGADVTDVTEELPTISAKSTVNVPIDVHGHGHLIVFNGAAESEFAFTARPKGLFWGLRLENASVTGAKLGKAKHED